MWVALGGVVFVVCGWEREWMNGGHECAGHGGQWLVGVCWSLLGGVGRALG